VLGCPDRTRVWRAAQPERDHNLAQVRLLLEQFPSLSFDDSAAEHAADIRAALAARGTPIGPADLLIAAIARANALALVRIT